MTYLKGLKHLPSLCEAETIFFDCETTGLQPVFGGLRLLQLATFQAPPVVIDCWDLKDDDWVVLEEFFDVEREWVAHNAVFDLGWLQEHCIYPRGRVLCTMLASRVLTNGLPNIKNGLQPVVKRYLGKEISKEEQRSDWSVPGLRAEQIEYAAYDVQLLTELYEPIQHRMADGGLHKAWYLECAALPAMAQLWRTGLPFDKQMLEELRDELEGDNQRLGEQFIVELDEALPDNGKLPRDPDGSLNLRDKAEGSVRAGTKKPAGFNINSPHQLKAMFTTLLGEVPVGPDGKPSASKAALREYVADHPIISKYLSWKRVEKRRQMVESLLKFQCGDGFIRASYLQMGADTGRMSCVSGDTILITSRGDFTFEEYVPVQGDLVLTHLGRWMPVVRKLYRGIEPVFEVVTAEGGRMCCTSDHKLWTGSKWTRISDLSVGDSLGLFKEMGSAAGKHRSCAKRIPERATADCVPGGGYGWNYVSQRGENTAGAAFPRKEKSGKSTSFIPWKNRFVESHEGQEWFPASQLHRRSGRSQGVFDGAGRQRREGVSAQIGDGTCFGFREIAIETTCASHRWEHTQQRAGQFGTGDGGWAQSYTPSETVVESIKSLGPVGVWDIEVEGDHSYALYGFLSHNCMSPNLQNVPRDQRFRACVQAPQGWKLVVADYAQMELRLAAAEAQDELMIRAFQEDKDLHTLTAMQIYGVGEEEVTKEQRQIAKSANFGLLFGSGARGLRNYAGAMGIQMSMEEAGVIRDKFHGAYTGIHKWQRQAADAANRSSGANAAVWISNSKLRRFLPGEQNKLTTRCNTPIQGAGAAVMKRALGKLWPKLYQSTEDVVKLAGVVHDEAILLVREDKAEEWAKVLTETMEEAEQEWLGEVPALAEAGIGDSWDTAK